MAPTPKTKSYKNNSFGHQLEEISQLVEGSPPFLSWRPEKGIFSNRIPLQNNSLLIFCHWLQGHPIMETRIFFNRIPFRTTACAYSATGCRATPSWGTSSWSALSFPPPCSPVRTPFAQALPSTRSDKDCCLFNLCYGIVALQARVSSKQRNKISVRTEKNDTRDVSVVFGLFRENKNKKTLFVLVVSVFTTYFETIEINRTVLKQTETTQNFLKKTKIQMLFHTVSVGLLFVSVQSKHRNSLFRYRSETTETNILFQIFPKLILVPVSVISNRN